METALYIALVILSITLSALVILQGRSAGLQNRDTSSIYRTKRGLEKTLHQATIAVAVAFLLLALITSLPPVSYTHLDVYKRQVVGFVKVRDRFVDVVDRQPVEHGLQAAAVLKDTCAWVNRWFMHRISLPHK